MTQQILAQLIVLAAAAYLLSGLIVPRMKRARARTGQESAGRCGGGCGGCALGREAGPPAPTGCRDKISTNGH